MDVKICKLDKKIGTHVLSMHRSISYLLCILSSWAQHVPRDPDIAPFCKDHLANHTRTTPRETCTKEIHEVKWNYDINYEENCYIEFFSSTVPQFRHFPPPSNAPGWMSSAFEWNPRSLGSKAPSHDCTIPAQIHPREARIKTLQSLASWTQQKQCWKMGHLLGKGVLFVAAKGLRFGSDTWKATTGSGVEFAIPEIPNIQIPRFYQKIKT